MRNFILFALLIGAMSAHSQSLPFDFETMPTTSDFVDFDGGTGTVIANPQMNADNPSAMVAQIVRDGGTIWSGSKIILDANLDFTTEWEISMKVFTTAPVGTVVKFKLEGNGSTETDQLTTVSGAWETMSWNFFGQPSDFNEVVFMFDFGNVGDGSETSTFLFDDVTQGEAEPGPAQLELPVTFEDEEVDYTMTDFGGNIHTLMTDPEDAMNSVCQVVKTAGAELWAGTTIGTNQGFGTYIPISLTDSKMNVKVWSPDANIPIRLKIEDALDPTHTCETETMTTVANEWEVLEFDFVNEAEGTAELSFGLDNGWAYNMASIFFNFGTDGATAGEKTYMFDDVQFGPAVITSIDETALELNVFPNPANDVINVLATTEAGSSYQIFDLQGRMVDAGTLQTVGQINVADLTVGSYVMTVTGSDQSYVARFIKQ